MKTRKLTPEDFNNVVEVFGQKVITYNILKFDKHNLNLGAFDDKRLIGIITAEPRKLIKPLDDYCDLFITYIEVLKEYQNQGIATTLIQMAEDFAKQKGLFQITSWSDEETVEMNRLALKLKFTMCQALMYDENYLPQNPTDCVKGYYYGKRLD